MEGNLYTMEKESCLQWEAYTVSKRWHCYTSEAGDCFMFQKAMLQTGFQSETYCAGNQLFSEGMSSSAGEIVVKSEIGETKVSPCLILSGAFGGTPNTTINLLRKPLSGKCRIK